MKLQPEHVEKPLYAAGYSQGRVSQFDRCDAIYFKSIKDGAAFHYQIEVRCYFGTRYPDTDYTGGLFVRLNNNTPWFIFEQHGFKDADPETIALWEERCAQFFAAMGCEPYERYE